MSSNQNKNNNKNKECEHKILSIRDRSCTVCGMSRYDQLKNKSNLTEKNIMN